MATIGIDLGTTNSLADSKWFWRLFDAQRGPCVR